MALEPGTRVGPYQVLSLLGAGGMGEVYRARDERLDRTVALKVLPADVANDAERLARFTREARAVAALSHPSIRALFDLGTHEGRPYAAMELLEGETLRERLAGGALPPRKAVDIATQIGMALAAAHEKGIVHRDLKPENVFLTRDGRVKVLDFGLARLLPLVPGDMVSNLPTQASPATTSAGMLLGTVGYMAPEQVRGEAVDARGDLFALGALLYEMVAGRQAFRRDSAVETLSAILNQDPPELPVSPGGVTPALQAIIRHCLEKRPEERFQSARDLVFDLQSMSTLSLVSGGAIGPAPAVRRWPLYGGAAAAAVLLALGAFQLGRRASVQAARPPSEPRMRRLSFLDDSQVLGGRFTADGQSVVYAAISRGEAPQVFSSRLDSPGDHALGIPNALVRAVSSRGDLALLREPRRPEYFPWVGRLARVPLAGGEPRDLLDDAIYADWLPGSDELAVVRMTPHDPGDAVLEFPLGHPVLRGNLLDDRVSPRGDLVATRVLPAGGMARIVVVDRAGRARTLTADWWGGGLAWSPDGSELLFSGAREALGTTSLYAVDLGGHVRMLAPLTNLALRDVSREGRLLVERGTTRASVYEIDDRGVRDVTWRDGCHLWDTAANGSFYLCTDSSQGSQPLYLVPTDGRPGTLLLGNADFVGLSPDDRWVAVTTLLPRPSLSLIPIGTGARRPVPISGGIPNVPFFLDDQTIGLWYSDERGNNQLGAVPLAGGALQPLGLPRDLWDNFGIAPDGRRFVYTTKDGEYQVMPVRGGAPTTLPFRRVGDEQIVGWVEGGKTLIVALPGPATTVTRIDVATGKRTRWREVRPPPGAMRRVTPAATRDGRALFFNVDRTVADDLYVVDGLLAAPPR